MNVKDAILNRSATRRFTNKKIPLNTLKNIIKIAQKSPSWVNAQSIRVYIATGNTLNKIRNGHGKLNENPNFHSKPVIPFKPLKQWDKDSQRNMNGWFASNAAQVGDNWGKLMSQTSDDLYNANAVVYLALPKHYSDWTLLDLGSFSQSIMLEAYELGIASMPAYEFIKYPRHLSKHLNVPDDEEIVFGIGLGYKDNQAQINKIHSHRMNTDNILNILK